MEPLAILSNDALLHELHVIVGSHRGVTAELIRHLGEVDARRLHVEKGFSSLFSYCVERLRFSEDEACRRIDAARVTRRFPAIDELLQTGAVSLTVLGLLKPHLTDANHRELLAGVSRSSVRQAKEWLAARFPKPDVPCSIRKQAAHGPARLMKPPPEAAPAQSAISASPAPSISPALASPVSPALASPAPSISPALASRAPSISASESASGSAERILQSAPPAPPRARIEPLSQDRFLVKFTASRAMRDKLELAGDLMRHANPQGDLAVVLERAVERLVDELQKKRQGRTHRPQKKPPSAGHPAEGSSHSSGGEVTRAARREVVARDGWRCSFVAEDGRHCGARGFLEFDHKTPKGLGGSSRAKNLRLLCRSHNRLAAERAYGEAHVSRAISASRGKPRDESFASARRQAPQFGDR